MVKNLELWDLAIFKKNHSDVNFPPIFKKIVSKCLAGYLHWKKNISKISKNVQGSKINLKFTKIVKKVKNMWFCWFLNFYKKSQLPQFLSNF